MHTKVAGTEKLGPSDREHYKPQPRPSKTMDDVELLIPLPLIEDGLHQGQFNWNPRTFADYKMCHFLSSNYHQYQNIQQHIDAENLAKMNEFIRAITAFQTNQDHSRIDKYSIIYNFYI